MQPASPQELIGSDRAEPGAPTSRPTAERQQQPRCCTRCSPHAADISRRLAVCESDSCARQARREARCWARCRRLSMPTRSPRAQRLAGATAGRVSLKQCAKLCSIRLQPAQGLPEAERFWRAPNPASHRHGRACASSFRLEGSETAVALQRGASQPLGPDSDCAPWRHGSTTLRALSAIPFELPFPLLV